MIHPSYKKAESIINKVGDARNGVSGFTLLETLLYIGIVAVVVSTLVLFATSILDVRSKTAMSQEVHANARFAFDVIGQKIRAADRVVSPSFATSSSVLELDMPTPNPNIIFQESGQVLFLQEVGGATTALTSTEVTITSLTFTNLARSGERDTMRMQMNVSSRASSDPHVAYSQTFQTAVSVRK